MSLDIIVVVVFTSNRNRGLNLRGKKVIYSHYNSSNDFKQRQIKVNFVSLFFLVLSNHF